MELDEVYRELGATLRKMAAQSEGQDRKNAATSAVLQQLIEILISKGVLADGHRRLFEKTARYGSGAQQSKVRLRVLSDKYSIEGADIDCASRFHLCHARCCSFSFELSRQDVEEGKVLWEIEDPYVIRHESDGYCSHLDRKTLFCTIHAQRPATCRYYDCRNDVRVWVDFEARIPAPMPEWLSPIRRESEAAKEATAEPAAESPTSSS